MPAGARPGRWVSLFVALLLASAAAFIIGVAVERNQGHTETSAETAVTTGEGTGEHSEAGDESLLGVDPESTGAVGGAVLVSVLLAAAAWFRPVAGAAGRRPVLPRAPVAAPGRVRARSRADLSGLPS